MPAGGAVHLPASEVHGGLHGAHGESDSPAPGVGRQAGGRKGGAGSLQDALPLCGAHLPAAVSVPEHLTAGTVLETTGATPGESPILGSTAQVGRDAEPRGASLLV